MAIHGTIRTRMLRGLFLGLCVCTGLANAEIHRGQLDRIDMRDL